MTPAAPGAEHRAAAPPPVVAPDDDRGTGRLEGRAAPRESGVAGLWSALEEVMDPEIPVSLVDLGLIYAIRRDGDAVEVDLTFTATACPCMGFIRMDIEERLQREPGVAAVRIREVWDPPWTKERITARGREQMKRMGISV